MGLWRVRFLHRNGDVHAMIEAGTSEEAKAKACKMRGMPHSVRHPGLSVTPDVPLAYELEIMGKRSLQVEREEDVELLRRLLLPGSNQNFVEDEFGRVYIAYADEALACARKRAVERLGFRVRLYSGPLPDWMKP